MRKKNPLQQLLILTPKIYTLRKNRANLCNFTRSSASAYPSLHFLRAVIWHGFPPFAPLLLPRLLSLSALLHRQQRDHSSIATLERSVLQLLDRRRRGRGTYSDQIVFPWGFCAAAMASCRPLPPLGFARRWVLPYLGLAAMFATDGGRRAVTRCYPGACGRC